MAPPVWTLVLLAGAAWGRGHLPDPVRKEKPPDWKAVARSSRDNSILTQCDFEDNSKPLCDWTQASTDDGDWIRASGPSPTGSTGPPGGYPNGEGHYLHMESSTFQRGGVARLRSPPIWEQGPLCVYFAYHMFGLSWGAQLRLLLLRDTKKKHPSLLWKHTNTQSPSWMPTAVTVPMGLVLPSQVIFEGVRGSTAYLDISLDAISIHRGSCNRICMMQTCSFDVPNDLCGWSWIPTASGAKWVQKKGPSGVPNVGPEGDFSSPDSGFYMLLDPKNAKPRQKSVLLSPLRHSSGCLSLSFHYILNGHSPGAALTVYASVMGSIRKHTLFSGQPGPNWQSVSVNYTGQGQIQFTVVGVFGETPEPAVAVDAISIAPCGESFPQCDFEDDAHPFCDWAQASGDGGHWTRGNKNMHIQGAGAFGEGRYIYVEADKFSEAGQSFRLVSRPFCAPGAICVEFAYHMYGLGEGTKLNLLLESPAGSSPSTIWHRVGSQSPDWLNTSVTIPLGHQQPMQLIFEAIRGTNTAFVVAVGFILINHGTCRGTVPTELPSKSPVSPPSPSETPVSTEKPMTPTEKPMALTEKPIPSPEKHTVPSEVATVPTENPMTPTEKLTVPSEIATVPTESPMAPTEKPTVPTEKTMAPTEKPTVPSEIATVPTESPLAPTEKPTVPIENTMASTEKPTVSSEITTVPTESPMTPKEKHTVPTEKTMAPTEKPTVHSEIATISTKNPMVPSEMSTDSSEECTFPSEKSISPTEKLNISTQKPTISSEMSTDSSEECTFPSEKSISPTEKLNISTQKPTIPTENPTVPAEETTVFTGESTIPTEESTEESVEPTEETNLTLEEPTISTEESSVSIEESTAAPEEPTVSTEASTVPFEEPTISTEKPTVHTEKPLVLTEGTTVTTERPTIPTEKPTIPTEKTTIPMEKPITPTEKPTIPIAKLTMSTERSTVPTEKLTVPTTKPTILTAKPTIPTPRPTISTKRSTVPTEKNTIPTEKPTVSTEKTTIPTEKPTVPTEKPTIPTEKPTAPTEETTIATEKPTVPTKTPTIPTEKPTVPIEKTTMPAGKPTIPTEKTTMSIEKPTIPTERSTIPTEKTTMPTENLTVPTKRPTIPTEKSTVSTEKTTIPTEKSTIPTEKTTIPTEKSTIPTEKTTIPTEKPTVPTKKKTIPTEKPTIPTEKPTIPTEKTTIPTGKPTVPTKKITIPTEKTTIPTEKTTIPTEKTTVPTEKTIIPTEKPTVPTDKTTIPTEKPTVPTKKTTIPTEKPTVPTEKTTIRTEKTTVPTEKTIIPTEKPTVPTDKTTIPTEKPTVPTKKTTIPTEKPTVPTEKTTIHTEKTTVPTEKTTIPTEKPTVPTKKTTIPTEKTTIPTEKPTVPTEKTTIRTEKTTLPTEKTTIPTEKPTVATKKTTISTEKPTIPTENPTIPMEKPTVLTKKPTIPTEKPTVPTKKTTIPTKKPTIPTEKPTIPTKKTTIPTEKPTIPAKKPTIPTKKPTVPTEKTIIPTEKSTIPTERPTAPTAPQPSPSLVPVRPKVLVMTPTTTPSTSMTTITPGHTPVSCPPNAQYNPCACPASCERPKPNCGPLCKPGCVCNSGFLFHESRCINASSCNCFYNNNYYKPGAEWFSSNCTERCHCRPGKRIECKFSQCGPHTVCQLKNGQYRCQPYGTATCTVYGDPHQITFDGRHFTFMGKCTYILAQPCGDSTEPFFRVAAKNKGQGKESMSILSKIYVTLPKATITLLGGRRVLVGSRQVTLPATPSKGIFLTLSGRFVELQTVFGLRVRWDGDQQLYMSVPSTYSRKLCGFCGNYDGDGSNDNLKPDGSPAQDIEELGSSWQTVQDEDKECQKNPANPPSCNQRFPNSLSASQYCGRLTDARGAFEACLPHLQASLFFNNCMSDMCKFQQLEAELCIHMAALTEICQDAGYAVKPWRGPQFCPLTCPPNSSYSLCTPLCPTTCFPSFPGMSCKNRCVEGCQCNPGFVLSGLQCVPQSQCGCLEPTVGYFKIGERWFKPGCQQLCACESNNRVHCAPWKCQAQEVCRQQDGIYGCHARGSATCSVSGDPHYLTFDGALHHFMGTCTYILTQPCQPGSLESYFIVSTTNEFRSGNLEASYVRAVNVQVFNLTVSLIKGYKVMLNGRRVALPLWPAQGRVSIRPSGSFILLYTDFGLQVRYDGSHLVEVTVPSSYSGRLCGLCGNYNNNSLDDSLLPNKMPVASSVHLGVAWKLQEYSEQGCFDEGGKPSRCMGNQESDNWRKDCDILTNPQGPFSQCHRVVPPQSSFTSCVYGQCETKGDTLTLCRSLQAYASLCSHAGQALAWRNSSFCPLKCPPGSTYSPCANPCPDTCLSLNPPKGCPAELPCTEGCECQKGHILSGTSCVPLNQCGCVHQDGSYHLVGESWYTDNKCSRLCTCSTHSNISCHQSTCTPGRVCWPLDGLLRCRTSGVGVCHTSDGSPYVTFDGALRTIRNTCTYVLLKVCHSTRNLPFFKISGKHGMRRGRSTAFYLYRVYIDISDTRVTLGEGHYVLINDTQATLPSTSQIQGVQITASGIYTVLRVNIGLQVKFDGKGFLEVQLPTAYYQKVCGLCGNFNDEEEDELMMPSDELAQNDTELVDSWQDRESDPKCQPEDQLVQAEVQEKPDKNCRTADLARAQERCEMAFRAPAWAKCASHVVLRPFLLNCTNNLCQFGGLNRTLCESLETFGAACRAQGLQPPIWRNSTFCPLECPAHSSYSTCLPSCSPSCLDLMGQCHGLNPKVPFTCKEGCVCQPDYVLNGQQCVPKSQCGCMDDYGSSFPEGKTWIVTRCTRSCACTSGTVHCQPFRCPHGSHCESRPRGTGSCEINKSEQCSIYGDPHYRTFDGLSYSFRGRMTYTLIKIVGVLPAGVVPLVVEGRNKVHASQSPIYLHEIIVMVYGYTVQLKAHLELVVNNQKMTIPYKPSDRLQVALRGHRLYLITDFEMVVTFDGGKNAVITLPKKYKGLVRGLCGNFDGNRKNDFMLPNGTITQNLVSFGNSWEVQRIEGGDLARFSRAIREAEGEEETESGFRALGCSPEQLELINSTQACRVLVDPQGPFAACHQTVAPEPFQEHCVFDLCAARNPREQEELRCQVLSGYAIICQEAGATLASWRDRAHCALACPANTVYQSCMTPCPASCAHLASPRDCKGPCVEGCASLPGYVYSGAQSLPLAHCGCTSNGVYYQRGDSFVTEDCSQRCTCARSGVLLCEPLSCGAGEVCTLGNLTRGCFRESPCLQNPCQNDGRCWEQGTHFTCECELGYGGRLCTEPRDGPAPGKPASNFVAILLGMLVPVAVLVPAVTRECLSRKGRRRREKMQNRNRNRLADAGFVPEQVLQVPQF